MHKSFWFFAATCVAGVAASVPTTQSEPPSAAIDIPFTSTISASDLTIERLSAEVVGEEVRFALTYTSGRDRYLSVFEPPGGGAIKYFDEAALKAPGGVAKLTSSLGNVRAASAITMRFSTKDGGERDRNFIHLSIGAPAVRPIFGDLRQKDASGRSRNLPSYMRVTEVREVAAYADIRFKDASGVTGLTAEKILGLRFNHGTRWNAPVAAMGRDTLQRGKNPGLGVRSLHRAGITGAGVSVGIIDQNLFVDHPEFKGRITRYHDVGCNSPNGSMHGPAVASLLVGKEIGTAPGACLYFVAAPSWTKDTKQQAEALNWLLDVSEKLPPAEKIRVISVSASPSGPSSPFTANKELWDEACARAVKAGVLVLDCTPHRGIIGACYYDPAEPDNLARVTPGFPDKEFPSNSKLILAPTSRRTVAEEYLEGECSYQYTGVGGLSWGIPYAAGVFALGWQVNPKLPPERMVELLSETAHTKDGAKIINPVAFVEAVKRQ